jgi:hypothetical protein
VDKSLLGGRLRGRGSRSTQYGSSVNIWKLSCANTIFIPLWILINNKRRRRASRFQDVAYGDVVWEETS